MKIRHTGDLRSDLNKIGQGSASLEPSGHFVSSGQGCGNAVPPVQYSPKTIILYVEQVDERGSHELSCVRGASTKEIPAGQIVASFIFVVGQKCPAGQSCGACILAVPQTWPIGHSVISCTHENILSPKFNIPVFISLGQ